MENKIRSTLNEIYFGKTKDIVNGLRYRPYNALMCYIYLTVVLDCWVWSYEMSVNMHTHTRTNALAQVTSEKSGLHGILATVLMFSEWRRFPKYLTPMLDLNFNLGALYQVCKSHAFIVLIVQGRTLSQDYMIFCWRIIGFILGQTAAHY